MATLAALALGMYVALTTDTLVQGASVGGSYEYRNYTSANASNTVRTIVKGGAGELGTVVINTTGAQPIRLYDAATTTAATSTLTKIGVIKPSTAEQSLTYDVAFKQGLTIEIPATYAGDVTFTVR